MKTPKSDFLIRRDLDWIDWAILDSLSDDYESVDQIQGYSEILDISKEEIIDRLEILHSNNYVFLLINQKFDKKELISEIHGTKQRKFWFGRTENGYKVWLEGENLQNSIDSAEQGAAVNP